MMRMNEPAWLAEKGGSRPGPHLCLGMWPRSGSVIQEGSLRGPLRFYNSYFFSEKTAHMMKGDAEMKTFRIMPENGKSYDVEYHDHADLDAVWLNEKPWFTPGTQVVIWEKDFPGNIKLFTA